MTEGSPRVELEEHLALVQGSLKGVGASGPEETRKPRQGEDGAAAFEPAQEGQDFG